MKRSWLCLAGLLFGVLWPCVVTSQTELTDRQVIEMIGSADAKTRERAAAYVASRIAPPQRTPELEAALRRELARLNELRRMRREDMRAGKPVTEDFPAEYYATVIELVSESSSPEMIAALAGALGTGGMVEDALAEFGEPAVPILLSVAQAPVGTITEGVRGDIPPENAADALTTLAMLLQRWPNVNRQTRAAIENLARKRMAGSQHPTVLLAACRLALATGDPSLRAQVARFAEDSSALETVGVRDPRWQGELQLALRRALGRK